MTGGCQCGRIRFRARLKNHDAYYCHCRMCQRATGGVAVPYVNLPKADRIWEIEPEYYASSPIARRPFCRECGTPLGFEHPDGPNCDLMVGCFDDPYAFVPTSHFAAETAHEAWLDTSHLPRQNAADYQPLVDRWIKATGAMPE